MKENLYIKLSKNQIDKIGNSIIYLTNKLGPTSKTKILKLIYILDEMSIKKSGIPFFNLKYKVWKFGPVSEELFIDLSSSTDESFLKKFIKAKPDISGTLIESNNLFNDDEFSDNDIDLMEFVISKFGNKTANDLVKYTHRVNSVWYNTAKDNSVLELLLNEEINNTELLIEMGDLVNHDDLKREIYNDYIESN